MTDCLVILLNGSQIFTSFGELSFLHTFSDIPMYESSFGVQKIELVMDSGEHFGNSGGVGKHANSSLYFGKISSRYNCRWLVVDTALESSGTTN
jgi:hypothetical protein